MMNHAVVIAGGGPTGLMLAGELALAGVDVAIVERRETQELAGLRSGGLHMRTIEVLDQRGIADRFISQGQALRRAPFAGGTLDIGDLPTRHSYFLALWQMHIERILADWVSEWAVPVYRGREVTRFAQDDTGVDIALSDGRSLRANYLVGCDGGRSLIRKTAGIDFPGWDPSTSYLIAEVETAEEPEWGIRRSEKGINAFAKLEDGRRARVVLNERDIRQGEEPTLRDAREALISLLRGGFWSSQRQLYRANRDRRVLLAGDTAHVHSPAGGQGLNIGEQDAVNRLEARQGGPRDISGDPLGYLPYRAALGRCSLLAHAGDPLARIRRLLQRSGRSCFCHRRRQRSHPGAPPGLQDSLPFASLSICRLPQQLRRGLRGLLATLSGEQAAAAAAATPVVTTTPAVDLAERQRTAAEKKKRQDELERQRIGVEQAYLEEERKQAGAVVKARLEQQERDRKAADEKTRQEAVDRQQLAAEKARQEEECKQAAVEKSQVEREERSVTLFGTAVQDSERVPKADTDTAEAGLESYASRRVAWWVGVPLGLIILIALLVVSFRSYFFMQELSQKELTAFEHTAPPSPPPPPPAERRKFGLEDSKR